MAFDCLVTMVRGVLLFEWSEGFLERAEPRGVMSLAELRGSFKLGTSEGFLDRPDNFSLMAERFDVWTFRTLTPPKNFSFSGNGSAGNLFLGGTVKEGRFLLTNFSR